MSTAQLGSFRVPPIENEPMKSYAPGSAERAAVQAALVTLEKKMPFDVPCVVNGKEVRTGQLGVQPVPSAHASHLCNYHEATPAVVASAIDGALAAQRSWESLPWADRAAIFLKAADLVSGKHRTAIVAATMLGQGKNVWQAEIDAAAELADFLRFGVKYVEELYATQPPKNSPGVWNRVEYRPLEGFVLAVSPFNFTAIGGNLCAAPALLGNVVVWKPSPAATYASYLVYQIFVEAGLPPGVVQFVPGQPAAVVQQAIAHPSFAALHFTGSTFVFKQLWKDIASHMDSYRGYPRIVGETGGKNFHVVHSSADVENAVMQTVRGAFEYQGQKCSACSRVYVPTSLWDSQFRPMLLAEVAKIKVGPPHDFANFLGPVIGRPAWDRIMGVFKRAKEAGTEVLAGGTGDDKTGYYIQPTVLLTTDPRSLTMKEEIFGPVLTVYVYADAEWDATLDLVDSTSEYGLTGAIFSRDRVALAHAASRLRHAAGNVYFNEKCTGAVVGQQPFGGARASGTNDKAGSVALFYRFASARSIKEGFVGLEEWSYPSNLV